MTRDVLSRSPIVRFGVACVGVACICLGALRGTGRAAAPPPGGLDQARIEELTGAKGTFDAKDGGGMGEQEALATAVGKVFARLKETAGGTGEVPHTDIDPAKTKMGGHTVGKAMGVNTWAAFAGSDDQAIVDGDFAMLESELQPVLEALRAGGINVVAIHNHMTEETPRILFLHYWGVGPTETLAKTIKSALDKTKHLPPPAP